MSVSDLAERRCIPCKGGVPPLTREQLAPLLAQIDARWSVATKPDEKRGAVDFLTRTYAFEDFKSAMTFATRIADVAEEQQHHPDLYVAWGKVRIDIWTHKIGGLTESDAIFAAKCDRAYSAASAEVR